MREAVPAHLPVSVKVRLGWDSGEKKFEIADAVQQGWRYGAGGAWADERAGLPRGAY
ncbi:tRNA-dihydrouridine synthase C [Escherichia coli]|uniref:tRNA-dihydrouridine synthase C n=1 Tax=Escherichia coli TaxID=562 RepID=A0A376Y7R7_ECOLX|nr:tRNA-dihydrouridine synthase C [Escherichia coli]